MLGAALQWSKIVPVFPCIPNKKLPDTEHGFKDATSDQIQITRWWTEKPDRNLAACPDDAGCFVIDADGNEGQAQLALWEALHGPFPSTLRVRTPSGGTHIWCVGRRPSSIKTFAPGIDIRGIGGYVLLPPSIVDGREYAFIT